MNRFKLIGFSILLIGTLSACSIQERSPEKEAAEATTQMEAKKDGEVTPVELDAAEYVKLGKYKGLHIKKAAVNITDKDVDGYIQGTLEEDPIEHIVEDRNDVRDGDYVNADVTVKIDGKAREEYSSENYDIHVGEKQMDYLDPDMKTDDVLIGAKIGSTVKAEGKVPKEYEDEDVAGKKVEMAIKINSISVMSVPELTDEYAKEQGYESVKDFREAIKQMLIEEQEEEIGQTQKDLLWQQVMDNAETIKEFPKEAVKTQMDNIEATQGENAVAEDMSTSEFIKYYYDMSIKELATYQLKEKCVEDLLCDELSIQVTDEDVDDQIQSEMQEFGYETEEDYLQFVSKETIKENLIHDKIIEALEKETTFE